MRKVLRFIPLLCFVLTLSSCCVFRGDCKTKPGQIATMVVDCSIAAVKSAATEMLPAVIAIITSGGTNWVAMLDALKSMGLDALSCAMQQAGQEIQNMSMTTPAPGMQTHVLIKMKVAPPDAKKRIETYLSNVKKADGTPVQIRFEGAK